MQYRLHYSWPYKATAVMLVVIGVAFPFLKRFVEWRVMGVMDWVIVAVFVVAGILVWIHYARTISVSDEAMQFGRTVVPWDRMTRVEAPEGDKFIVVTTSGEHHAVSMDMKNIDAFLRDVDARFGGVQESRDP